MFYKSQALFLSNKSEGVTVAHFVATHVAQSSLLVHFSHVLSPNATRVNVNSDKYSIVISDLIVICNYSHQKSTKLQPVLPKGIRGNPEIPL